ncbi:hypothetical protein FRC11_013314, partial [Ceratobasidium sp. 423]
MVTVGRDAVLEVVDAMLVLLAATLAWDVLATSGAREVDIEGVEGADVDSTLGVAGEDVAGTDVDTGTELVDTGAAEDDLID